MSPKISIVRYLYDFRCVGSVKQGGDQIEICCTEQTTYHVHVARHLRNGRIVSQQKSEVLHLGDHLHVHVTRHLRRQTCG